MKILLPIILLGIMISGINTYFTYTSQSTYSFDDMVTGIALQDSWGRLDPVQNFSYYNGLKYVNLGHRLIYKRTSFLNMNKEITMSFWFKLQNFSNTQYIAWAEFLTVTWYQNTLKIRDVNVTDRLVRNDFNHVVITTQKYDSSQVTVKAYFNRQLVYEQIFSSTSDSIQLILNDSPNQDHNNNLLAADVLITRETWSQTQVSNEYDTVKESFNLGNTIYKYRIHGLSLVNEINDNGTIKNQGGYTYTGELSGTAKDRLRIPEGHQFETKKLYTDNQYNGKTINFWAKINDKNDNESYTILSLRQQSNSSFSDLKIKNDGTLCFAPSSTRYCARGYIYLLQNFWFSVTITTTSSVSQLYINGQLVTFDLNESEQAIEPINRLSYITHYQHWSVQFNSDRRLSMYIEGLEIIKSNYSSNSALSFYNTYSSLAPLCAVLYSDCGYTGDSQVICGREQNLSLLFMRSIILPPGKQIRLFTGAEFTGEQQLFTESVECQELVYLPQEESQN